MPPSKVGRFFISSCKGWKELFLDIQKSAVSSSCKGWKELFLDIQKSAVSVEAAQSWWSLSAADGVSSLEF